MLISKFMVKKTSKESKEKKNVKGEAEDKLQSHVETLVSKPATPDEVNEERVAEVEDEERLRPANEKAEELSTPADSDYLRQYQYKNVNGNPVVGGQATDPDSGSKAAIMKVNLLSQPRVSIFIPRREGESPKVTLSVNLNGYRLDLPKQTYLELPKQVAEVIIESQRQQVQALQPFRIDRDKDTNEALS